MAASIPPFARTRAGIDLRGGAPDVANEAVKIVEEDATDRASPGDRKDGPWTTR
jgi:hypothetical protein